MAFQNEPTFMAACRLSNVFSSDGSITASRFMPTLGVRFTCDSSSRDRHTFTRAHGCLIPETCINREIKKAT
jgi:hypothetical protein